jgi:hypothetical protein
MYGTPVQKAGQRITYRIGRGTGGRYNTSAVVGQVADGIDDSRVCRRQGEQCDACSRELHGARRKSFRVQLD